MTRRRWWLTAIAAIVAAAAGGTVLAIQFTENRTDDCAVVRSMIDYNRQFRQLTNSDDPDDTRLDAYTQWAGRLHDFAAQIHDPQLAGHANALADLADQILPVFDEIRADPPDPSAPEPPSYLREYDRIGQSFVDNMNALIEACPDSSG